MKKLAFLFRGCLGRPILRGVGVVTLLSLTSFPTGATTIVVKLEKGRIFLAADSRLGHLERGSDPSLQAQTQSHAWHDDGCKLVSVGRAAAGVSGDLDYKRIDPVDEVPDWSAASDANFALAIYGGNLRAAARDWVQRATQHYEVFRQSDPARVRALANVNSEHVLVDAFFVGWEGTNPMLIWEKVALDETSLSGFVTREQILPP
jgi:hypothetical protein